jgi:membrane protein DedA with SNARE-associated domain
MEILAENHALQMWLLNYGSLALFALLLCGILALPIPEETLLVISGVLINNGDFRLVETTLAAIFGSIGGITLSYILGRTAGLLLITRYGRYIGVGKKKLERTHNWFERFGKWALFIGYFIPGVRHFTGFFAGMSSLHYAAFAAFAYSGAILWVITFLAIGYYFSDHWYTIVKFININLIIIFPVVILAIISFLFYLLIKKRAKK